MKRKLLGLILTAVLILPLTGCSASKPKPGKESRRPSLFYQPGYQTSMRQKYPLKVAVLTVRDKRVMPFYNTDNFFKEPITDAVSDSIYLELKSSGMFKEVVRVKEISPRRLTQDELFRIQMDHGVDMIFIADLTAFNILRDKQGVGTVDAFKITIDVGLAAQLIYLEKGYVVWADSAGRQEKELAKSGALNPSELGALSSKALKATIEDIKKLVYQTGKEMRRS